MTTRIQRSLLVVALLFVASVITTAHAQILRQFAMPEGNASVPYGITLGPDVPLWLTNQTCSFCTPAVPNKIGRIPLSGVISEFTIPSGGVPYFITSGPDGALWFTEPGCVTCNPSTPNRIGRITVAGVFSEFELANENDQQFTTVQAIAGGPDGALWYTKQGCPSCVPAIPDTIGRITTAGVVTAEYPLPAPNSYPYAITNGPDTAGGFTELGCAGCTPATPAKIGTITPGGVITEYPLAGNTNPTSITSGPDAAVWFTENDANKIGRISIAGAIEEFQLSTDVPLLNGGYALPLAITNGPNGSLWFVAVLGDNYYISRFTTTGMSAVFPLTCPQPIANQEYIGCSPDASIAVGDGAMWFP